MAVATRTIAILGLLFVATLGCAGETDKSESENIPRIYSDDIVQLAYAKMLRAVFEAEKTVDACLQKEKNTIIPAHVFPKLPLSDSEWKFAIAYLSAKALNHCQENVLSNAVMAFSQFKFLEKKVTGKNAVDVSPSGTYQYEVEDLCCGTVEIQIRTELKYQKIDPEIRNVLEGIPELNKPFNPVAAIKALRF